MLLEKANSYLQLLFVYGQLFTMAGATIWCLHVCAAIPNLVFYLQGVDTYTNSMNKQAWHLLP
jgi:hypothetical protein